MGFVSWLMASALRPTTPPRSSGSKMKTSLTLPWSRLGDAAASAEGALRDPVGDYWNLACSGLLGSIVASSERNQQAWTCTGVDERGSSMGHACETLMRLG